MIEELFELQRVFLVPKELEAGDLGVAEVPGQIEKAFQQGRFATGLSEGGSVLHEITFEQ